MLLRGLPHDALYPRRLAATLPEGGGNGVDMSMWTLTDRLLAMVVEVLAAANWQRGGGKGTRPVVFPPPRKVTAATLSPIEARALLARVAGRELS